MSERWDSIQFVFPHLFWTVPNLGPREAELDSPQVDPEDVLLVPVLLENGLQAFLEALQGRLACPEHGEAGQLEITYNYDI